MVLFVIGQLHSSERFATRAEHARHKVQHPWQAYNCFEAKCYRFGKRVRVAMFTSLLQHPVTLETTHYTYVCFLHNSVVAQVGALSKNMCVHKIK